jgi:hypothetical protein
MTNLVFLEGVLCCVFFSAFSQIRVCNNFTRQEPSSHYWYSRAAHVSSSTTNVFRLLPIVLVKRNEGVGYATGRSVRFISETSPTSMEPALYDESDKRVSNNSVTVSTTESGAGEMLLMSGTNDKVTMLRSGDGFVKWDYNSQGLFDMVV